MASVNEHYLKLSAGYLFPEIARRVQAFLAECPQFSNEIIRCGIGDVTEPLPRAAVEAMKSATEELAHRASFKGYGPGTGYEDVRRTIAEGDFRSRGLSVADDEIFLSDGSKGDCSSIMELFSHSNRIAITDPVYPAYVDGNVMFGNTGGPFDGGGYEGLVYLPCTEANGFLAQIPCAPVDLIYLCSPSNPTGTVIPREQLAAWVAYARKHRAIIFYDAAYEAYIQDPSLPRSIFEIEGARECAVEFRSFSKSGGFTGVRCGYTVLPKSLCAWTEGGQQIPLHPLWTRRWNTRSNGVSYAVQRGAQALYSVDGKRQVAELVSHYLENARLLHEGCVRKGLAAWGGTNAPYVWVRVPAPFDSWAYFEHILREARVVVTPGAGFGRRGEGFIRISAFNSRANVVEVVRRLASVQ